MYQWSRNWSKTFNYGCVIITEATQVHSIFFQVITDMTPKSTLPKLEVNGYNIIASLIQWIWTWENSGRWWGTGRPVCCSPRGCRGVHDLATGRQQQQKSICYSTNILGMCVSKIKLIFRYIELPLLLDFSLLVFGKPCCTSSFSFCLRFTWNCH